MKKLYVVATKNHKYIAFDNINLMESFIAKLKYKTYKIKIIYLCEHLKETDTLIDIKKDFTI